MTPNRAEATCLIRASWRLPSGPGAYQAGSSPPSPVLAEPPARWMPMVSAWCASGLSAPTLIADTTNRRTIARASSTAAERDRRGRGPDAELVARDGALRGGSGEGGAVAGQGVVDADGVGLGGLAMPGQDLDLARDPGREQVRLAVGAEPGEPGVREPRLAARGGFGDRQRGVAPPDLPLGEVGQRRPAGPGGRGREAARDDRGIEIDDVDERAADVRRDGADAHPGQGLAQAGLERGHEAEHGLGRGHRLRAAGPGELGCELDRETRVDRGRADGEDHGHRVDVEDVGRADRDVGPAAQAGIGQGGVHGTRGEDRGHRQPVDRPGRVADDDQAGAAPRRRHGLGPRDGRAPPRDRPGRRPGPRSRRGSRRSCDRHGPSRGARRDP